MFLGLFSDGNCGRHCRQLPRHQRGSYSRRQRRCRRGSCGLWRWLLSLFTKDCFVKVSNLLFQGIQPDCSVSRTAGHWGQLSHVKPSRRSLLQYITTGCGAFNVIHTVPFVIRSETDVITLTVQIDNISCSEFMSRI